MRKSSSRKCEIVPVSQLKIGCPIDMLRLGRWLFPVLGLILNAICWIRGARVLIVDPFESHAQCRMMTPYIQALTDRGHQLTVIHAFKHCKLIQNVSFIRIRDNNNVISDFEDILEIPSTQSKWEEMSSMARIMANVGLNVLNNEEVRALMQSNVTFDLVVVEPYFTDVLYGLAAHFKAPLIGLSTCAADWNLNSLLSHGSSNLEEPLQVFSALPLRNIMNRMYTWYYTTEEWLLMQLVFLPKLRLVHDHFFGHLDRSFLEIRHSFSLLLMNQHFSLFRARSSVSGMIEVAGLHIPKQIPRLPEDLQLFIDEAEHGVIYFALGVEQKSKDLPKETKKMLLESFKSMPQRVIWKFEEELPENLTSNIYLSELLPQQAILAHPNVRLFISHGGILSIIEATYFAKPVLGVPLFFDQFRNLKVLMEQEAALQLNINSMTKEEFMDTLGNLINQPKYRENALAMSQKFRDRPMHPMETAIYWTEYIMRYKGANHLRVLQSQIKLVEYYCLDKFLIVGVRLFLVVGIVLFALLKGRSWLVRLTRYAKPFWNHHNIEAVS
ncbi:UDP-glycosyltransferase UGT5 isoform X1 [Drosophila elegans]|uniref:UDP-glycosyltransferase UGT5 isoform X1 n=2 Tax=Drosophila elegans TaxID=30023 RepID=UPI0007E71BDF|nr:UDP-glycosyltransferase UGT5 isoform X1 [Drosophila elegans]